MTVPQAFRGILVLLLLVVGGCATSPTGAGRDGGPASDGGLRPDGGAVTDGGGGADGGALIDGGAGADGGARMDGGPPADGGPGRDGGPGGDGGISCPTVVITPASQTAAVDCDALDEAAIRAQVCAGQRIATGLYDETAADHIREWEIEGDGSGNTILACRDTSDDARALVLGQELGTLTGCETVTDDYFSFEAISFGGSQPDTFFRVNKCTRWPYIVEGPNAVAGASVGQVGPAGVTVDAALAAHVAQYLWYVERDQRPEFFLVGARPVSGGAGVSHALCEAELSAGNIVVRKVTFTISTANRDVSRSVEAKGQFPANCP